MVDRQVPFAIFLEAECGQIGDNWEAATDSLASGNSYIVVKQGFSSVSTPPEDVPANYTRFRALVQEMDEFHLWGRVRAATPDTDSYWVRINGGEWLRWFSNIQYDDQWRWREVVSSPYRLPAGEVTIDIAYREPATKLDKLYLTTLGRNIEQLGKGGPSANCDEGTQCALFPELCISESWIEAECSRIGSQWNYTRDVATSNAGYLIAEKPNKLMPPTGGGEEGVLTFDTEITEDGDYTLFFRLNARDRGTNSFWVKVDGKDWIDYSYEIGGGDLLTEGFEWRPVNMGGDSTTFRLISGEHTIRVAVREAGSQLDKIYLGRNAETPVGFGKVQLNCQTNDITPVRQPLDLTTAIELYPNPVDKQLTLKLSGQLSGGVEIGIVDATGKLLSRRQYQISNGDLQDQLDVSHLPAGLYRLLVTSQSGIATRSFIVQ